MLCCLGGFPLHIFILGKFVNLKKFANFDCVTAVPLPLYKVFIALTLTNKVGRLGVFVGCKRYPCRHLLFPLHFLVHHFICMRYCSAIPYFSVST